MSLPTSACRGTHVSTAIRSGGGRPCVVVDELLWGDGEQETLTRLQAWNQPIHRVRGRIEKIFGTWTRSYGLRCM